MLNATDFNVWYQSNRDYLIANFNLIYNILLNYINQFKDESNVEPIDTNQDYFNLEKMEAAMPYPSALDQLCQNFGLSEFERFILVFCAAVEIDPRFPNLCVEAHNGNNQHNPTFGLALSALSNVDWSALAPDRSLRYWKLLDLGIGTTLTSKSLHIDERILHYLVGVETTDSLLTEITELPSSQKQLIPSHQYLADSIEALWELNSFHNSPPIIQLCGSEIEDKTDIAQAVYQHFNLQVSLLNCHRIPLNLNDLETFIRRLKRECILEQRALLLICEDIDHSDKRQLASVYQLLEGLKGFVIVTTLFPLQGLKSQMIRFDVPKPLLQEQLIIWETSVAELKTQLNGQGECIPDSDKLLQDLQVLTSQFQLSTSMIRRACTAAVAQLTMPSAPSLQQALWQSCRIQARPGLDELAERIESKLSWDDLVLPPLQKGTLKEISAHVRQKAKVYEKWGFASKSRRGLGITVLFSGPSGTGKTLAAGVLANELNLDLYRIELSAVVSKYIGETEKNLQQIFNAAESGGG